MKKRPISITVISWFLIVGGGLSLINGIASLNNPMVKEIMAKSMLPVPVQYIMFFAGILVTIISGASMLKGKNWARLLYVIWRGMGFLISFITSPMRVVLIPGFVFFAVIVFFLFRPQANEYFAANT